ncbi:hypothetical protein [Actinoplanes regularis]|uniref:hypothetical protein n=1 Tax=Actinoplanes regularis TaxID=52697 RepID=UPI002554EE8E|nr:hypothetical protein [Actinoplanes regularis]
MIKSWKFRVAAVVLVLVAGAAVYLGKSPAERATADLADNVQVAGYRRTQAYDRLDSRLQVFVGPASSDVTTLVRVSGISEGLIPITPPREGLADRYLAEVPDARFGDADCSIAVGQAKRELMKENSLENRDLTPAEVKAYLAGELDVLTVVVECSVGR